MKLIFLGAPGAGKGTIAKKVNKEFGWPQVSTGDMLRENVTKGTELGLKAKEYMDKGDLVPDEVVIGMLKDRIAQDDCKEGFILDGFPRTIPQAEALDEAGVQIDKAVNFTVSEETLLKRLTGRWTCKECGAIFHTLFIIPKVEGKCDKCDGELYQRDDQKLDVVKVRLEKYNEQTAPLIGFYSDKELLVDVDGEPSPDEVFDLTKKALGL